MTEVEITEQDQSILIQGQEENLQVAPVEYTVIIQGDEIVEVPMTVIQQTVIVQEINQTVAIPQEAVQVIDVAQQGQEGIQGVQGIQGEKGDKGDTGTAGAKGDKGDTGSAGAPGPNTVTSSTTTPLTGLLTGDGAHVGSVPTSTFLTPSGDGSGLSGVLHSFTESDPLSLHLDQTVPQHVINGAPIFEDGLIAPNLWASDPPLSAPTMPKTIGAYKFTQVLNPDFCALGYGWVAVDFLDENLGWGIQTTTNQVYKTTDGGATWTLATTQPTFTNYITYVKVFDANNIIVTDRTNIFITADGGTTWTHNVSGNAIYGISFVSPSVGYSIMANAYNQSLHKTVNGGATWTDLRVSGLGWSGDGVIGAFPGIVIYGDNNGHLVKTLDDNATVTIIHQSIAHSFQILFVSINEFYIQQNGSIEHTTDQGVTWTTIVSTGVLGMIDPTTWLKAFNGDAALPQITTDGGATYSDFIPISPAVAFPYGFNKNTMFVANGALYKIVSSGTGLLENDGAGNLKWTLFGQPFYSLGGVIKPSISTDKLEASTYDGAGRLVFDTDGTAIWQNQAPDLVATGVPAVTWYYENFYNVHPYVSPLTDGTVFWYSLPILLSTPDVSTGYSISPWADANGNGHLVFWGFDSTAYRPVLDIVPSGVANAIPIDYNNPGTIAMDGTNMSVPGNVTAASLVTTGGASTQFMKGDGSLDGSTYLLPNGDGSGLTNVTSATLTNAHTSIYADGSANFADGNLGIGTSGAVTSNGGFYVNSLSSGYYVNNNGGFYEFAYYDAGVSKVTLTSDIFNVGNVSNTGILNFFASGYGSVLGTMGIDSSGLTLSAAPSSGGSISVATDIQLNPAGAGTIKVNGTPGISGTFSNPTSITVQNGIVTAIS